MDTYVYFYKNDSLREPIGRVKATSLSDAIHQVTIIKKLSEELIEEILVIQKLD